MRKIFRATWIRMAICIFILLTIGTWFCSTTSDSAPLRAGFYIFRLALSLMAFGLFFTLHRWKVVFKQDRILIDCMQDKFFFNKVEVKHSDIIKIEQNDDEVLKIKGKYIYISIRGKEEKLWVRTTFFSRKKQLHAAFEDLYAKVEAQNQEKVGPSSSSV